MGRAPKFWGDAVISLIVTGCAVVLLVGGGELYFRATRPILFSDEPHRFVPDVGRLYQPGAVVRRTNQVDFWTEQTANASGFLDREAPDPETVKDACRIALIGDSYVDAREVPLTEKTQSVMMQRAAAALPDRKISVSAYGFTGTGQLNQLPFYDRYARDFHPDLIVLVFVTNDFANNSALIEAVRYGFDPDHPPRQYARKTADGGIELLPVDNDGWNTHLIGEQWRGGLVSRAHMWLALHSYFYAWLHAKLAMVSPDAAIWLYGFNQRDASQNWLAALSERPGNAAALAGLDARLKAVTNPLAAYSTPDEIFSDATLPPAYEDALAFTGFALDQFVARAQRDGARLVIFATESLRMDDQPEDRRFKRLKALAEARDIPIIDFYDFLLKQGKAPADARLAHDPHWNATGHQLAAQALLDYLKATPSACPPPVPLQAAEK